MSALPLPLGLCPRLVHHLGIDRATAHRTTAGVHLRQCHGRLGDLQIAKHQILTQTTRQTRLQPTVFAVGYFYAQTRLGD